MKTNQFNLLSGVMLLMLVLSFLSLNVEAKEKIFKNDPLFEQFIYRGMDKIYENNPLKPDEFYNPILQGCYPDPSITRKGDDFYLVCSSFAMFPGVPIFHSIDLVNWKQIGHVLDRTSQLQVADCGISMGVYAPTIRYNAFNDTFYMITTEISGGFGNIVVKTKDPMKGWSDPIKLKFDGIDPSLFFDEDGKAYIIHNDAPAKGEEQYNGHRVIKIWEYDTEKDQIIPGTDQVVVNGGVDIEKKPIWIEAPHIYKKDGHYYLMCAEGGTGGWHSEVVFISDSPKGPYKPAPSNPILTQRYFPQDRQNKVDWAGHADLVEGNDGKYYGVFLGIRPNEKDQVNTGRETFILPVDWSGTFPVFENGLVPMEPKLKMPAGVKNQTNQQNYFPNGNFVFTDDFTSETLDDRWVALRGPREDFISSSKKGLKLTSFAADIKERKPISSLFYRQQHSHFVAQTTMKYKPNAENELAGITCYQSERFNFVFGITKKDKEYYIVLEKTEKGKSAILAQSMIKIDGPITLKVEGDGVNYCFEYSVNQKDFYNVGGTVLGNILSTNVAGGFTGAMIGLYATSGNDVLPQ